MTIVIYAYIYTHPSHTCTHTYITHTCTHRDRKEKMLSITKIVKNCSRCRGHSVKMAKGSAEWGVSFMNIVGLY